MTAWTDKHYNYAYKLTPKDIEAGEIRVDAYFVAKAWKTGSKDDSGALWHCLKTIARFGDKNDVEREIRALHAQVKGLARSFGVELEETDSDTDVADRLDQTLFNVNAEQMKAIQDLLNNGTKATSYNNGMVIQGSSIKPAEERPWYPDSGNWIEYDGSGQPIDDDLRAEVLQYKERKHHSYSKAHAYADMYNWKWDDFILDSNIVAYKIVE